MFLPHCVMFILHISFVDVSSIHAPVLQYQKKSNLHVIEYLKQR